MNLYHKKFLESFAAENVIAVFNRYKNAAKEITESWALLEAAKKYVPDLNERLVIVVGDGCSPRTGVLFAYYTKAEVYSIDPEMRMAHWKDHYSKQTAMGFEPKRINVIQLHAEDFSTSSLDKKVLVIWPHSHANMDALKTDKSTNRIDIAMPCCNPIPANWMAKPHICYDDFNVISPKRRIHIWRQELKVV